MSEEKDDELISLEKRVERLGVRISRLMADYVDICKDAEAYKKSKETNVIMICLLYTSPSPRDKRQSRMPSSA